MTPTCPRPLLRLCAALTLTIAPALGVVTIGFAQDGPTATAYGAPSSLSPQQATEPGQSGPTATPLPDFAYTDVQISYEVVYLEFPAQPWRNYLKHKGRLTPCETGLRTRGWTLVDEGLTDLSKQIIGDIHLTGYRKVTAFENDRVTFLPGSGDTWYFDHEDPPDGRWGFSPDVKGSRIDLSGSATFRGTRLSVDLRDAKHVAAQDDPKGGPTVETSARTPTGDEFRFEGSYDIPTGSSLLVRLDGHERPVGSKSVMIERLVIIKPRRILLEPEPRVAP